MPYTIDKPPDAIKTLPKHAQEIWIAAFNTALPKYKQESACFAIAWKAIRTKFTQDKDGKWIAKSDYGDFIMGEAKAILPAPWYAKIQAAARAYAGGKAYKPNREHATLMKLSPDTLNAMKDAQIEKLHARAHTLHKSTPTVSDVHSVGYVKLKNLKKFHGWLAKEMSRRQMAHDMMDELDSNMVEKSFDVTFIAKADEQQIAYGVVYEPDVVDSQGDWASAAEIEKAAHRFLELYRQMDVNHDGNVRQDIVPVESYLAPVDFEMGDPPQKIIKGSWIVGVHAGSPETWQDIKSDKLSGLSMFGLAHRKDGTPSVPVATEETSPKVGDGLTKYSDEQPRDEQGRFGEGGTASNPNIEDRKYWDRNAEQLAANIKADYEYAHSEVGRRDLLTRKLDGLNADKDAHTPAEIEAVRAEIKVIDDKWKADFKAEWTPDVTTRRRTEWNAYASKHKMSYAEVRVREKAQGWTVESLRNAVTMHKA